MRIGKVNYNGVSSDTLGVFVSGSGSYDAAEYDVTKYEVMGRNGDILIPNNRYKNIEVTYPCFIPNDFETRVQAVRNWMRSARSYARIEDNYDLLHYRMGIGKGVLKFSPAQQSIGANAQLVFNCKPQRFLKSGEEEQDVVRTPYSFTGDTVEFETDEVKTLEKAEVTLAPSQNGTPWISATPDTEPYLYRALPSNVGNSELDTLVGGTVNWNQLASLSASDWTLSNASWTEANGVVTIQSTAGGTTYAKYAYFKLKNNHVYRYSLSVTPGTKNTVFGAFYSTADYEWRTVVTAGEPKTAYSGMFKAAHDTTVFRVGLATTAVSTDSMTMEGCQVFDLTAMFGSNIADYVYTLESGTAGAGVAWLKKYGFITKDYYAYDAGSLLSVKTSAKVITGVNLFDRDTVGIEQGAISSSTGGNSSRNDRCRTTGYVPVKPNAQYTLSVSIANEQNPRLYVMEYSGQNISNYIGSSNGWQNNNYTFVTGASTEYLRFVCAHATDVTMTASDVNWVMLQAGDTATAYVAYTAPTTYSLDSDLELRGPLALDANNNLVYDGDVYPPSGNVTREIIEIDLGDLTWTKQSTGNYYWAKLTTPYRPATNTWLICAGYEHDGYGASGIGYYPTIDKAFRHYYTSASQTAFEVYFHDESYTTKDAFVAHVTGMKLAYELKTQTTESADPYTSPQSVSDGGTEEYVDSRTVPMPVGHRTYYANIVPITGETGANLTHTGVNLLGGTDLKNAVVAYIPTASVDTTNKYVSFASGSATNGDGLTEGVPFKENTRYTFIMTIYKTSGTGSNLDIRYTDGTHTLLGSVSAATTKETLVFVSAENKTVSGLYKYNQSGYTRIYYEESGIFEGVLTASQFTEYQGATYNVTFTDQGTVYGGTYDFVTGTLKVTHASIASYNGETIGTPWLSSYEEYSVGATPTTGAQVVYPLESPQTYSLTPQAISSIVGTNYVWSNCPPVTVGYSDPFDAHNPTQYEAKPLLKLENPLTGAVINVNAFTITATTSYTGVVEIDCESQNIYSGDTNLNSIFTVANFPVLQSGSNVITFSDADSMKIVPRWWEL